MQNTGYRIGKAWRKLVLLMLISQPVSTSGQDFSCIVPGEICLFEPVEEISIDFLSQRFVQGLRIDSVVEAGQDTLYYFQRGTVLDGGYRNGPSWLGYGLKKTNMGDEVFFNYENREILLKPAASPSQKWVLLENDDGSYIQAECISIDTVTFSGFTDSVKTIELQPFDISGKPDKNEIYGKTIKISKKYGLIRTFNFREFPSNDRGERLIQYELAGSTKDRLGLQVFTGRDIYNYESGDEFHIITYESDYNWNETRKRRILNIMDKRVSINSDTLFYDILERWEDMDDRDPVSFVEEYTKIYTDLDVRLDSKFLNEQDSSKKLPFESLIYSEPGYIIIRNEDFNGRYQMFMYNSFYDLDYHFQFKKTVMTTSFHYYQVIEGCQVLLNSVLNEYPDTWTGELNTLVYFKKGNEDWGSPLVVGTPEIQVQAAKIWPNPVHDWLCISLWIDPSCTPLKYTILDITGQVCDSGFLNNTESYNLNITGLKPGIYFIKTGNGEKPLIFVKY